MNQETVYLSLGSNLNNPIEQINRAFTELAVIPHCEFVKASSLFKTKPLGPPQPDYINACVELVTTLTSHDLLEELHAIENLHGRTREVRWGPRTLDIDILLYGSHVIRTESLIIPHRELANRQFVLIPLFELNPHLILPCKTAIRDLQNK